MAAEQALSTLVSLSGAAQMSIDRDDDGNADGANSDADETEDDGNGNGDGDACVVCGSDHSVDDDILVICEGCEMSVHQVTKICKISWSASDVTAGSFFCHFCSQFSPCIGLSCFIQSCYGIKDVPVDSWFCEVCMVYVRTLPGVGLATDGGVLLPSGMNSHCCDDIVSSHNPIRN